MSMTTSTATAATGIHGQEHNHSQTVAAVCVCVRLIGNAQLHAAELPNKHPINRLSDGGRWREREKERGERRVGRVLPDAAAAVDDADLPPPPPVLLLSVGGLGFCITVHTQSLSPGSRMLRLSD